MAYSANQRREWMDLPWSADHFWQVMHSACIWSDISMSRPFISSMHPGCVAKHEHIRANKMITFHHLDLFQNTMIKNCNLNWIVEPCRESCVTLEAYFAFTRWCKQSFSAEMRSFNLIVPEWIKSAENSWKKMISYCSLLTAPQWLNNFPGNDFRMIYTQWHNNWNCIINNMKALIPIDLVFNTL